MLLKLNFKELVESGIVKEANEIWDFKPDDILKTFFKLRRAEVTEAYVSAGISQDDISCIDEWIGYGSVTCYEYEIKVLVGFGCDLIMVSIEK